MKNKNEKNILFGRNGKAVMDNPIEAVPGRSGMSEGYSWLASTLKLDQDTKKSQLCSIASEVFLRTRLFPLMDNHRTIDEAVLVDQLVDFKRARGDLNVYFEMSHVTASLLNRFQCHLIDDTEGISDALEMELNLFRLLADLDFQRIDVAVCKQLDFG